MPSSRITKTSKTPAFGKSRQMGFTETKDFNIGDSVTSRMTRNADNTIDQQLSHRGGAFSEKKRYVPSKALKDSKVKNNAGVKAVGSYARNYFKNNSK